MSLLITGIVIMVVWRITHGGVNWGRLGTAVPLITRGWSAIVHAQSKLAKNEDVAATLQKSPVVQAVMRRMQQRSELQSQVSSSSTARGEQVLSSV